MIWDGARTDLAVESGGGGKTVPLGVARSTERHAACVLHRMTVTTSEAAVALGRPIGTYVTLECAPLYQLERTEAVRITELLSEELRGMTRALCGRFPGEELGVLIAGLGNARLTADAIGPETVGRLHATRHLRERDPSLFHALGCSALSALAPGVLDETGIETLELLRGAVRSVHPDLVVVVDALAARDCARLASTIQLSDSGIIPGSGIGDLRTAITAETLGVPVVALGVPTVVDSATLVCDALERAHIEEIGDELAAVLENGRSFFVSPKESDLICTAVSTLFADAITSAFVGDLV